MSGYILCQTKKAEKPYFVENISTNIYSLEELCYYLYHNLYLVDSSVMNEGLCIWISEELDLPRLAAKLRPHLGKFASIEDVLYPIFKEINYLTYDELKALNVKLAKLDPEGCCGNAELFYQGAGIPQRCLHLHDLCGHQCGPYCQLRLSPS